MGKPAELHLQGIVPVASLVATGGLDVVRELVIHDHVTFESVSSVRSQVYQILELTLFRVVADSEVRRDVATGVAKTLSGAVNSGAANLGGVAPDDLGEVAPLVESVHVDFLLAVLVAVEGNFSVVEELSDYGRDVVGLDTGSNVLAVGANRVNIGFTTERSANRFISSGP